MHCPNCGNPASTNQQFCRTCGLNLAEFSQLLGERLPSLKGDLELQKRKFEKWALRLWTGAGVIFYIALYWAIISTIIIGKGHVLGGILFLLVITALSLGGLFILYAAALEKRSKFIQPGRVDALPYRDTAQIAPTENAESIVSVTENTTDLLESDQPEQAEQRTTSSS